MSTSLVEFMCVLIAMLRHVGCELERGRSRTKSRGRPKKEDRTRSKIREETKEEEIETRSNGREEP